MRKLALIAGLLLPAGCGSETRAPAPVTVASTPAPPLTAGDRERLRRAEARVQRHCVAVARSVVDPTQAPTAAQQERAYAAADTLIDVVRANPRAELSPDQDLRLYLGDVIENLEGANCDPRMQAHLERALGSIPR